MANTVHVAAAIIYNNDKIFVVQRAEGSMTGRWEFPGGKVEEGETAEQACRREIKEELGIDLQTMWFMDTVTYDYEDFTLSMDCFVAPLPTDADAQCSHLLRQQMAGQSRPDVRRLAACRYHACPKSRAILERLIYDSG